MQSLSLVATLAAALSASGGDGWVASAGPSLPEPIVTRQTLFSIPFQVQRPQRPEEAPVEVQLHVSADQGATWHFYSKVEPERGYFLFRAGGDGQFWFLIRTLDRSGQIRPQETQPGLRVIVDTSPPKLELNAARGPAGQLTVHWQVEDANFDPESLRLQYRTAANPMWQFLAVDHRQVRSDGPVHRGEVTWWASADDARVEIRCETADRADNPAVSHAQLAGNPAQPAAATVAGDFAPGPSTSRQTSPPATTEPSYAFPPSTSAERPTPYSSQDAVAAGGSIAAAMPAVPKDSPSADEESPAGGDGPLAIQFYPAIRNRYVPPAGHSTRFDASVVPQGESLRMVSSKVFELEYEVESVGPSGVGRVELWGSRDGGRSWSSFDVDDDSRSPLSVAVDEEGIFGFRVVVQDGSGRGGNQPRAGDKPDVWIGVDATKPKAQLLDSRQDAAHPGRLLIRWEADDALLAERPVSLYFSRSAGGPWLAIATDLENSGEHLWPIDEQASGQIWLRLEVRDRAGNVGVSETKAAISRAELQPVVRIRDVRPLDHAVQSPARRYFIR